MAETLETQRLSYLIDRMIADILLQRKTRFAASEKQIRVVISGEDLSTLSATLACLAALNRSGYLLVMTFSCSASQSALQAACLAGLTEQGIDVLCDSRYPSETEHDYCGFYFPALSTNSLSKISLGIRDNLVCHWALHALSMHKPTIMTRNAECLSDTESLLPRALLTRLARYINTLKEYGFTVADSTAASGPADLAASKLVTLKDIRQHPQGYPLDINHNTLITPAARDEIRDRGIVITRRFREDSCI